MLILVKFSSLCFQCFQKCTGLIPVELVKTGLMSGREGLGGAMQLQAPVQ